MSLYLATIMQSGSFAPSANVLVNTLGEDPEWSYVAEGFYTLISAGGVFLQDLTLLPSSTIIQQSGNGDFIFTKWTQPSENIVVLQTYNLETLELQELENPEAIKVKIEVLELE